VFSDFHAAFYVADAEHNDRAMLHSFSTRFMESLNRAGAPFDLYLAADLCDPHLADYRVYIFPDAFHMDEGMWARIQALAKSGRTLLFLGVPACISDGDFDLERTRRLCVPPDRNAEFERLMAGLSPDPLNRRSAEEQPWRVGNLWYAPAATLAPRHLRQVYDSAGAHVWLRSDDILMAGAGFVGLHASSVGEKWLQAPGPMTWVDVRTGATAARDQTCIRRPMAVGETVLYAIR